MGSAEGRRQYRNKGRHRVYIYIRPIFNFESLISMNAARNVIRGLIDRDIVMLLSTYPNAEVVNAQICNCMDRNIFPDQTTTRYFIALKLKSGIYYLIYEIIQD